MNPLDIPDVIAQWRYFLFAGAKLTGLVCNFCEMERRICKIHETREFNEFIIPVAFIARLRSSPFTDMIARSRPRPRVDLAVCYNTLPFGIVEQSI